MQRNAARPPYSRAQRTLSIAALLAIAALVLLHAVLLWQRLDDRSIVRPEVAIRWIAGAAIAAAPLFLRRKSVGWREWTAFWLTVTLLHLAGPAAIVLSQVVLIATPLLLMLVALTASVTCDYAALHRNRSSLPASEVIPSFARNRAPPPR